MQGHVVSGDRAERTERLGLQDLPQPSTKRFVRTPWDCQPRTPCVQLARGRMPVHVRCDHGRRAAAARDADRLPVHRIRPRVDGGDSMRVLGRPPARSGTSSSPTSRHASGPHVFPPCLRPAASTDELASSWPRAASTRFRTGTDGLPQRPADARRRSRGDSRLHPPNGCATVREVGEALLSQLHTATLL